MNSDILEDWNPWWRIGTVPPILVGEERKLVQNLTSMMHQREILIISGIRRSGKTTIMYQLIYNLLHDGVNPQNILFVNVEDPRLIEEDLQAIISTYRQTFAPEGRVYVLLDEIQQMKKWEQWLKMYYEQTFDIKFIISGSNSALLMGEYATLLTGRNLTVRVFPFAFDEFITARRGDGELKRGVSMNSEEADRMVHDLEVFLEQGGFPEPIFSKDALHSQLVRQYFQDIIYRDIIFRHGVNPEKVTNLAVHLVTNSGNPMSMRKLRNITGLSFDSLTNFLGYLENAFLLVKVDPFSFSTQSGISHQLPRKYYVADTGLRNVIALRFSRDLGRNAENAVAIELWRQGISFSYWMGKGKQGKVDFAFLGEEGKPVGINVSYSDTIEERETRGLREFESFLKGKVERLLILSKNTSEILESEGKTPIEVVPLWKWLLGGK